MVSHERSTDWEVHSKCLTLDITELLVRSDTLVLDLEEDEVAPEMEERYDIFYPPRHKALYKPVADRAKAVCKGKDGRSVCPVKRDCLLQAIRTDEEYGIWGGLSHRERNALVRKAEATSQSIEELVDARDVTWDDE